MASDVTTYSLDWTGQKNSEPEEVPERSTTPAEPLNTLQTNEQPEDSLTVEQTCQGQSEELDVIEPVSLKETKANLPEQPETHMDVTPTTEPEAEEFNLTEKMISEEQPTALLTASEEPMPTENIIQLSNSTETDSETNKVLELVRPRTPAEAVIITVAFFLEPALRQYGNLACVTNNIQVGASVRRLDPGFLVSGTAGNQSNLWGVIEVGTRDNSQPMQGKLDLFPSSFVLSPKKKKKHGGMTNWMYPQYRS
ncbi:hypothetical protein WMY93_005701 [Mugilogobius chulae]|uniref:Uncharacterized protein n=1 Tax=Mugilogobius chulae TaxID=88201 RepID=A0AAW0PTU5_9GOBI